MVMNNQENMTLARCPVLGLEKLFEVPLQKISLPKESERRVYLYCQRVPVRVSNNEITNVTHKVKNKRDDGGMEQKSQGGKVHKKTKNKKKKEKVLNSNLTGCNVDVVKKTDCIIDDDPSLLLPERETKAAHKWPAKLTSAKLGSQVKESVSSINTSLKSDNSTDFDLVGSLLGDRKPIVAESNTKEQLGYDLTICLEPETSDINQRKANVVIRKGVDTAIVKSETYNLKKPKKVMMNGNEGKLNNVTCSKITVENLPIPTSPKRNSCKPSKRIMDSSEQKTPSNSNRKKPSQGNKSFEITTENALNDSVTLDKGTLILSNCATAELDTTSTSKSPNIDNKTHLGRVSNDEQNKNLKPNCNNNMINDNNSNLKPDCLGLTSAVSSVSSENLFDRNFKSNKKREDKLNEKQSRKKRKYDYSGRNKDSSESYLNDSKFEVMIQPAEFENLQQRHDSVQNRHGNYSNYPLEKWKRGNDITGRINFDAKGDIFNNEKGDYNVHYNLGLPIDKLNDDIPHVRRNTRSMSRQKHFDGVTPSLKAPKLLDLVAGTPHGTDVVKGSSENRKQCVSKSKSKPKSNWSYRTKRALEIRREKEKFEYDKSQPCIYYKTHGGICKFGDKCRFSHNIEVDTKMECCKYYVAGACIKGDSCSFIHGDWPCKFFHKLGYCNASDCRFSHGEMSSEMRVAFEGRLAYEESLNVVNNTENIQEIKLDNESSIIDIVNKDNTEKKENEKLQVVSKEVANKAEEFQFPSLYYELT